MRVANDLLSIDSPVALSANSAEFDISHMPIWSLTAALTGANVSNKTFISGVAEVQTLTFPALVGAADGDYVVVEDTGGVKWAIAMDTTGLGAAEPTGAIWTAIPADHKVYYDFSAAATAAQMAAKAELAFNSLTGFSSVITTNDTANDGTMLLTQVLTGPVVNPVPKTKDDAGAGSIAGVQTTGGVLGDVSLSAETATVTAHGYLTGVLVTLTTSNTLPTGLATSTNYYLIVVNANTVKFATSQANALAGTAINLTGYGTGTHTIVATTALAGSVKIQVNNEPINGTPNWVDLPSSSTNFSAAGNTLFNYDNGGYRSVRAVVTVTSGTVAPVLRINSKGA